MQTKMDEDRKRREEDVSSRERMRWGKTPECQPEPSSSSGQPSQAQPGGSTEGMAAAACPPTIPKSKLRPEMIDPPSVLEDIHRKVSTAHIEKDKQLGDISDLVRSEEGKQAERPVTKPGILLNVQFEDEFNQGKRTSTQGAGRPEIIA